MMLQSLPVHPDVHVLQLESPAHAEPGQDRTTRRGMVMIWGGGGGGGGGGKGGGRAAWGRGVGSDRARHFSSGV